MLFRTKSTCLPFLRNILRISLLNASMALMAVTLSAQSVPGGFVRTKIADLAAPTRIAFAPDGRIFVTEQAGRLRVIKNGALLATPFCEVTTDNTNERGLETVVFDPNFATNHYLYIYYTATTPVAHNRVSRFTADPNNPDIALAGSEYVILEIDPLRVDSYVHNGSAMKFSADGTLFVSTGENAQPAKAPDLGSLLGKILRIDVRTDGFPADPDRNYTIPSDNPFAGAAGARPEIWAYGLRNPFSIAFQPGSNRLFIDDTGSYQFEEINEGVAGSNYGWPQTEGYTTEPGIRSPLFTYNRNTGDPIGCAISGGDFYNPATKKFPNQYFGKFFFTDYCGGWIYVLDTATYSSTRFASDLGSVNGIGTGPDGNLYYLTFDDGGGIGGLYRISFNGILSPQISTQPQDQLVSIGYPVTFKVAADGDQPMSYQWKKNGVAIPGATSSNLGTSSSYTIAAVAQADEGSRYSCVITNSWGSVTSREAVLSVTTKLPPQVHIDKPVSPAKYSAGETITFSGSANDPQDGVLPPSALTWEILFEHHPQAEADHHTHPFYPPVTGISGGSVKIPTSGETDTDVYYRILLTAKNSFGLSTTTFLDVTPRLSEIYLTSSPQGLQLALDGSPHVSPFVIPSVVNLTRNIGAPTPQVVNDLTYDFYSWSDGGGQTHNISTPVSPHSFVANFWKRAGYGTMTANPNPILVTDGSGIGTATLYWSSVQTGRVEVHVGSPAGPLFGATGPGSFSAETGNWVMDGMVFYLQDATNGQPLTSEFTLDTVTVHLTTVAPSPPAATGSISADPNPMFTDPFGQGATTLVWTTYGTTAVQVRLNAPDGTAIFGSEVGSSSGYIPGWAFNGMTFYLQNRSNGLPLTAANTLATVTLGGAGSIWTDPEPIPVAAGATQGVTTVHWSSYGTSLIEIHLNAPDGNILLASGPGTSSRITGNWVTEGLTFYLQDVSNGRPLTAANTLATTTAHLKQVNAPGHPSPLLNISTRGPVESGEGALIGGLIMSGQGGKVIVVRARGASLASVPGALQDPLLELHDQTGAVIASNDNWRSDAWQAARLESFGLAPQDDRDSALITTINPGVMYTVVVRGKGPETGIAIVEIFDVDAQPSAGHLGNLSSRGSVEEGDRTLIGGFITGSGDPGKVFVRAIGPSLGAYGVANPLLDPTLEIRNADGTLLMANNNWQEDSAQAAAIRAIGLSPSDPRESAVALTLAPGAYTAVVRGNGGGEGIGLIEVYKP
jgi:glucose/arabinose dehydrogenase